MERNALDEFLNDAVMKEQDFSAQKGNVVIVSGSSVIQNNTKKFEDQLEYEDIRIPRRPKWDYSMTPDQLQRLEWDAFLKWRRELAQYEESTNDKHATPYEKNIEVWKQLWRVAERSHVVAQIVDARNPLLYYCDDLFAMSKELDPRKSCVLIINKSDYLTPEARQFWGKHFEAKGIKFAFWSALEDQKEQEAIELLREKKKEMLLKKAAKKDEIERLNDKLKSVNLRKNAFALDEEEEDNENEKNVEDNEEQNEDDVEEDEEDAIEKQIEAEIEQLVAARRATKKIDPYATLNRDTLIKFFHQAADKKYVEETHQDHKLRHKGDLTAYENTEKVLVGMLGFPNVGKSSTINAIIGVKKVSVSSTAGHTKHFQTLNISDSMVLCDCPGLVFPTFVHTKSALVINGVIPVDTLREFIQPVEEICQRIGRSQIIEMYGLDIPAWKQMDANTLLSCYARMRGFYKNAGLPDLNHAARIIIKDFNCGKLLHCQCPPKLTKEERKQFYDSFFQHSSTIFELNTKSRNVSETVVNPISIPAHGKKQVNDPLAFESATEDILLGLRGETADNADGVINVPIHRKKIVTVQPEVEKVGVYDQQKPNKLQQLDGPMTKKQLMRLRNSMKKERRNIFSNDEIIKHGAAGTNSSKFYGHVIDDNGRRVKQ